MPCNSKAWRFVCGVALCARSKSRYMTLLDSVEATRVERIRYVLSEELLLRAQELRAQELYESRGGRPGPSLLVVPVVSMDVKLHWTERTMSSVWTDNELRAQELYESRCGRPGPSLLVISPRGLSSLDVKQEGIWTRSCVKRRGGGWGGGGVQWLERWTRDWKVVGSSPSRSGGTISFSLVNFLCWLLFRYLFHPVLPQ